jgi:DNA-binding LytR/AlgR family response regulator
MNFAQDIIYTYRDFDLEKDILYFKISSHGLVCFHGKNFNVTKRISSEQLLHMTKHSRFFKVNMDSYANIEKIEHVAKGKVYFASHEFINKSIPITRLRQHSIHELLARRT